MNLSDRYRSDCLASDFAKASKMGALQSIPFCSREKQQKAEEVPPLQLDNNNNEAVVDQPPAAVTATGQYSQHIYKSNQI